MELDEVCGMPILFNVEVDTCEVRYAKVARKPVHHDACDAKRMSTLRPEGAHIISVVVDSAGGCFVYTVDANMFVMKPSYALDGVLPPDSVVHAFLFTNKAGVVNVGVFDVTRISGVSLMDKSVIERYIILDKMIRSGCAGRPMPAHVSCHWVGHEAVCMDFICNNTTTFVANSVMRVPTDPRTEQCMLVLRPLVVPPTRVW